MIIYNWQKVNNYYKWNPSEVLKYFYFRTSIKPPAHIGALTKAEINSITKFTSGFSYLINPEVLLINHSSVTDMYDYIHIASLRNLFDYKVRGVTWLCTWQLPKGMNLDNPLMTVEDDKIHLKYETV